MSANDRAQEEFSRTSNQVESATIKHPAPSYASVRFSGRSSHSGRFYAGSMLSRFTLPAPDSQQTLSYLGLRTMDPCTISQIGAKLILIAFVNVYVLTATRMHL